MTVRGRKRKSGKRYPCGKRTRTETEKDIMETAIEARQRHYGVTAKQAKDERLGTAFGAYRLKASNAAPPISTSIGTSPTAKMEAAALCPGDLRSHRRFLVVPPE